MLYSKERFHSAALKVSRNHLYGDLGGRMTLKKTAHNVFSKETQQNIFQLVLKQFVDVTDAIEIANTNTSDCWIKTRFFREKG